MARENATSVGIRNLLDLYCRKGNSGCKFHCIVNMAEQCISVTNTLSTKASGVNCEYGITQFSLLLRRNAAKHHLHGRPAAGRESPVSEPLRLIVLWRNCRNAS